MLLVCACRGLPGAPPDFLKVTADEPRRLQSIGGRGQPITMIGQGIDDLTSSAILSDIGMNRIDAKRAVKILAEADRIAFTDHAKIREPARGKLPLTREQVKNCLRLRDQEKHEVACVLVVEKHVLIITGYEYRGSRK